MVESPLGERTTDCQIIVVSDDEDEVDDASTLANVETQHTDEKLQITPDERDIPMRMYEMYWNITPNYSGKPQVATRRIEQSDYSGGIKSTNSITDNMYYQQRNQP